MRIICKTLVTRWCKHEQTEQSCVRVTGTRCFHLKSTVGGPSSPLRVGGDIGASFFSKTSTHLLLPPPPSLITVSILFSSSSWLSSLHHGKEAKVPPTFFSPPHLLFPSTPSLPSLIPCFVSSSLGWKWPLPPPHRCFFFLPSPPIFPSTGLAIFPSFFPLYYSVGLPPSILTLQSSLSFLERLSFFLFLSMEWEIKIFN